MLHSLSVLFCSPSPPRSPSTLFHSSFSTSPFLLFPLFPIFLPLVPLFPPSDRDVYSTFSLLSLVSQVLWVVFAKKKGRRGGGISLGGTSSLGRSKKRIISAPSFLLEVENDFHAGWRKPSTSGGWSHFMAKLSGHRSKSSRLLLARMADRAILRFLAIPSGIFASFASLSKMSKSLCAETIVPCTTVMIV